MRFLIDSMLPPRVADALSVAGHDAVTPERLGAHNLPDETLVRIASAEGRTIVTENAADSAHVDPCPVLLVRKAWWPAGTLGPRIAAALVRWAEANHEPGPWAHWLPAEVR